MKVPTVVELVKDNSAHFVEFRDDCLWYAIGSFAFPIPISDASGGTFRAAEKSLLLMRWIRKHVEFLNRALAENETNS